MSQHEIWAPGDYTTGNPDYHRDIAWALRFGAKAMVAAGAALLIAVGADMVAGKASAKNESDVVQMEVIDILAATAFEAGRVHHDRQAQRFITNPRTE